MDTTREIERSEGLIDATRLSRWLDAEGLPGAGLPLETAFVSGGASNEIFALRRGEHRMALRRPPRRIPKGRNETMLREYRVLSALRDTDVPHARALAACDDPGILHGDYQFANVMFQHGGPARMAAIVDWEMSTVGDPLLDLGWVLMGWPEPGESRPNGYVDYEGMPGKAALIERYAAGSGLPVDEIDYYVVLARFKMACVLEGGYARYVQGGADNPKMAAFGDVVLDMAARAAELARTSPLPARS